MNDNELITAVLDSVADVHTTTRWSRSCAVAARCAAGGGFPAWLWR
jgi:hypothetical protein